MRQQFTVLHKMLLEMVRGDLVCRRLMTAPGVGAVVALTYRATVDQPQRFVHSRAVAAHVGLTPKRYQSGGSTTTAGCPNVATPCYAQCSTKPHTHCSPQQEMVVAEGVGRASRSATRDASSDRRGRQASGRGSSPDVGRW
jgi:hypothetical protein